MLPYIRPASRRDIFLVGERMRERDVSEVRAASGYSACDALRVALDHSAVSWTACAPTGEPFACFGAAPFPTLGFPYGCPWFLATDAFAEHAMFVLKHSRDTMRAMHKAFPILINYVDCRNADSIRYLRMIGFKFTAYEHEFGVERIPFLQFASTSHV